RRGGRGRRGSSPTWCGRDRGPGRRRGSSATPSAASCRSIWCPPTSRSSTPCRSLRAARWTAAPCASAPPPTGRLDRGALGVRIPAGELAPAAEPDGDLETEIEELVAGIWQDLLRR